MINKFLPVPTLLGLLIGVLVSGGLIIFTTLINSVGHHGIIFPAGNNFSDLFPVTRLILPVFGFFMGQLFFLGQKNIISSI